MAIERLSVVDSVRESDSIPLYSATLGDVRAPVSALASALAGALVAADGIEVQRSVPADAGTVVVGTLKGAHKMLMLSPAAALTSLSVSLPAGADMVDGQSVRIFSTAAITTLTLDSAGASFLGATPSLVANSGAWYRYDAVLSAWVKLA